LDIKNYNLQRCHFHLGCFSPIDLENNNLVS